MMELARVDTWARRYDLAGRGGETRMQSGDKQKIRSRLRSYERKLQKEKREQGFYRDGAGKRYQIGPYYLGAQEGNEVASLHPLRSSARGLCHVVPIAAG